MKVDFSSVNLHSIPQNRGVGLSKVNQTSLVKKSEPLGPVVRISFKGNLDKNLKQVASIAAEDKGLGIPEYNRGGLGVVAQEAPASWTKHQGMDVRSFIPYHSYDNANGGIKVLKIQYDNTGKRIDAVEPNNFRTVTTDYKLKDGEKFVIQSAPSGGKSKFIELEDIGIKGSVKRLAQDSLDETEIPYHLFKAVNLPNKDGVTRYIMHTQDLARLSQSYGGGDNAYGAYGAYGNGGGAYGNSAYGAYSRNGCTDLAYADSDKAVIDALPKLKAKEHGDFNPGNIWAHDRTAFPAIAEVADRSAQGGDYYRGLRIGGTYHNPGRAYQGVYNNPFDFLRLVASPKDIKELKSRPDFEFLQKADIAMREGKATMADMAKVDAILKPFLAPFIDDKGTYNITMIPSRGTQVNPHNIISGTVSRNYGIEMKNHNTFSIAEGLTDRLAATVTADITNGSTPANLKVDDPKAGFGRGNNGLTENKAGFKTYKAKIENDVVKNIDEILDAKKQNAKWLINMIANADESDPEALQKIFFDKEAIKPSGNKRPSTVLGKLSAYEEGDKLIMGWGRPDPQKGYPTTFEGFLKYLQDPSVSDDVKKHTKLIVGAGADTWTNDARDWKNIQKLITQIQNADNGKYKGNVMYVNGLFPNRLVGCAHSTLFTSVFEPCGITPLESYSAGTPVISIKTGGAPDFITHYNVSNGKVTNETGFLTEGPYLRNPDTIGLTPEKLKSVDQKDIFGVIDDQRRAVSSDEVAKCIKDAVSLDDANYKQMTINAFKQKVDWHQNAAYNGGMSANTRYMREIWQLDEKTMLPLVGKERNLNPLKRLVGKFGETVELTVAKTLNSLDEAVGKICSQAEGLVKNENITDSTMAKSGGKAGKLLAFAAIGTAAVGGTIVYLIKKNKPKAKIGDNFTPQALQTTPIHSYSLPKTFANMK